MKTQTRVAGIWIVQEQILLESLVGLNLWGIPGGRLEPDEALEQGCVREYREETGIEMRCRSLAILHEYFWHHDGIAMREYGFYFIVEAEDPNLGFPSPVQSLEEELKFQWFHLDEIERLNFVPQPLKSTLSQLGHNPIFISTKA
jgi:8-oxo-dGTP pyrophosphatase MutT (NUDIX family)